MDNNNEVREARNWSQARGFAVIGAPIAFWLLKDFLQKISKQNF